MGGKSELIVEHLWVVEVALSQYPCGSVDRDDLRAVGHEALVRAALRFRPGPAAFKSYAFKCVYWSMHNYVMEGVRVRKIEQRYGEEVEVVEVGRWSEIVDWNRIKPREELVLWCRFKAGLSLVEISRVMSITKERVRQIEAKSLGRLSKLPSIKPP